MEELDKQKIIEQITNQLKSSYRKYKTSIYYDSYSSIQRLKLADFETNPKIKGNDYEIDEIFETLAEIVVDEDEFNSLTENICGNIDVIAFPKNFNNNKNSDRNIIKNFHNECREMDRLYYFIDLDVVGHIIGVLWILRCGYLLDDKLYKNCYGNRINKYLLEKLKNKHSDYYMEDMCYDFSPFLFKPYFKNYESWRDNGLDSVNNLLENKKNVIMFSMDLKEYYYRSLIDFKSLKKDIDDTREYVNGLNDYEDNTSEYYQFNVEIDNRLTEFVKNVFCAYSNKFNRKYKLKSLNKGNGKINTKKHPMIPLGFSPSLIISNWYLQGFDQAILENVRPDYYGRYVDDILIVMGSHEKSKSHGSQQIEEKSFDELLEKYLTIGTDHPKVNIFSKEKINDKDYRYRIYDQEFENSKSNKIKYNYGGLEIQSDKLKSYYFSHKCSNAMIENFKNEIIKNSSEFRLMHPLNSIEKDFKKNLYKIDYKDSINKLGDINKVGINKFEISKILSRINWISCDTANYIDDELIDNILAAFEGKIFEYMTLWEKIFLLLLINNKYSELNDLIIFIQKRISNLQFTREDNSYTYLLKNDKDVNVVKKSLRKFLFSTLVRIFSLKNNFRVNNIIKNIKIRFKFDYEVNFTEDICNCLYSSMQNNSFMRYPLEDLSEIIEGIQSSSEFEYDLIKRENKSTSLFKGFCYPRFIKFHEFILHFINNEIFDGGYNLNHVDLAFENYQKINFDKEHFRNPIENECKLDCSNFDNCPLSVYNNSQFKNLKIIKTWGKTKESIKVGLLNTKLDTLDFKKRIMGNPNLLSERFDKIKNLINESIYKNVDLLVMPEMYIPYEWVEKIVKISKDHQMAIIFGVEPIEHGEGIGNYIMMSLPFIFNDKYLECGLVYRLKNHYSPEELKQFENYGKKVSGINNNENNSYYMCIWNGIHIVPYYCYEIASLDDRSVFKSCCDIVTVSEFNKDTKYFNSIAKSLSRDLYCFCIKSNTSEYGGSCIIQPTKSETKFLINLKGGEDDYIVTQKLDIKELRENAVTSDLIDDDNIFKPKPPGFCRDIVWQRLKKMN